MSLRVPFVASVLILASFLSAAPTTVPVAFPATWAGTWSGECVAESAGGRQAFTMQLTIAATPDPAAYQWTITYIDGQNRQDRRYRLVAVDPERARWQIDEQNSIVLPATLIGSTLICAFDVQDSRIIATYRLTDDAGGPAIAFDILTVRSAPVATGGKDGAPPVQGFEAAGVQRAMLRRQR